MLLPRQYPLPPSAHPQVASPVNFHRFVFLLLNFLGMESCSVLLCVWILLLNILFVRFVYHRVALKVKRGGCTAQGLARHGRQ